jgi:hypothetical protein
MMDTFLRLRRGLSRAQVEAEIEAAGGQTEAEVEALISVALDPFATFDKTEDFFSGTMSGGNVGDWGWNFAGGVRAVIPAEGDHVGILRTSTGAVIDTISWTATKATTGSGIFLPATMFEVEWLFRLEQTDANTEVRLGAAGGAGVDFTVSPPLHGVYFEKLPADTDWFGVCRNNGVQTRTAALSPTDTAWHRARVRRVDGATIGFSLDGGTEALLTANVPTTSLIPGNHVINRAAVDKLMYADACRLRITGLVR